MVLSEGIVRFWKGWCGNPSGSRPNFFGRQHLTFDKGGEDMVLSEGLLSFCEGCGDGEGRCNGRGKPTPLRKVGVIVRMRNWQSVH